MFLQIPSEITSPPQRIISLVPSQTELLHYLGLEKETIGITRFCIHPGEWFRKKIRIGGTKNLNMEKIISLQPDLIIANKEENVKEQVDLLANNFPVWVTDINSYSEAIRMISDIGVITNTSGKSEKLISEIESAFTEIHSGKKKSAAYLIWKDPYMTAGGYTFINDMMEKAGFFNVFAHRSRYPEVTAEEINSSGCAYIFLSSEPYPFKDVHAQELKKSIKDVEVQLVDGEMFSWYGSRMLAAPAYFKNLRDQMNL